MKASRISIKMIISLKDVIRECDLESNLLMVLKIFINKDCINKILVIRQSGNTIQKISILSDGLLELHIETSLGYREKRLSELHVECFFMYDDGAPQERVNDNLIADIRIAPIKFQQSKKYLTLKPWRERFLASCDLLPPNSEAIKCKSIIEQAILNKEPFSVIRLGDGEGRLLGYPDFFNIFEIIHECIGYQFGRSVFSDLHAKYGVDGVTEGVNILRSHIQVAVQSANLICAPSSIHFEKDITNNNCNAYTGFMLAVEEIRLSRPDISSFIPDLFIFKRMHRLKMMADFLRVAKEVSIISHSHPGFYFEAFFGVKILQHYPIPGHQTFMKSAESQFPYFYEKLIANLEVKKRGQVFLISGGYLGKLYAHIVKSKGGIALDIGSLFDDWTGIGRPSEIGNSDLRLHLQSIV